MIDNRQVHFHQYLQDEPPQVHVHHNYQHLQQGPQRLPKSPGVFGFIGLIVWIMVFVWIFK